MGRFLYIAIGCITCFGVGAYVWKVKNTGITIKGNAKTPVSFTAPSVLVEVAGQPITADDVDWEYTHLIDGVFDKDSLTSIPDLNLNEQRDAELFPLKKTLIAHMVERKLLYAFIRQDKAFELNEASRFTSCLAEWRELTKKGSNFLQEPENQARLKSHLCEKSILQQYLKEVIFPRVEVTDAEVEEYYKQHRSEFKLPERVEIRQIVLADEGEAKRQRARLNASNFAELAKELSIAPEAEQGGRLAPFMRGEMPGLFDSAFHMRKGEISNILKSTYGFHIIMLLEKYPARELSLKAAKAQISKLLRRTKEEAEYQAWVERALSSVSVISPKVLW